MQNANNIKKNVLIALAVFVLFVIGYLVYNVMITKVITVHSDEGALLFVATEQDGEWTQIGIGSASYSTRQDDMVYFQATKDSSVSQVALDPNNVRNESIEIKLVSSSEEPLKIYEGPVTSVLVEDNTLYGVNATTFSIISAGLDEYRPTSAKFIGLPYIENIIWRNSENFFYRTYSGDVGVFSGGKDRGYSYFGSKGPIVDIARFDDKPIAFLSVNSIYLTPDFNQELVNASEIRSGELYYFSTDDEYVYYATFAHPSDYASDSDPDSEDSSDNVSESGSTLLVLDYNGNTVVDLNLGRLSGISGVTALSNNQKSFAVSSDNGLTIVDEESQKTEDKPIYSSKSESIVSVNGHLYIFMPDSIWRYDEQSATMILVVKFSPEQFLAPNSVIKSADDNSVSYTLTGNESGVYKLNL